MLKTLVFAAALVLTVAACATTSPTDEVARKASLVPAHAAPAGAPRLGCVSGTGTRLAVKPGECVGFGETFTRDDILATGQSELGPALEMLDPRLTVHGH
jgi:hypothetical protein